MPFSESFLSNLAERLPESGAFASAKGLATKFLPLQEINEIYERVQHRACRSWFDGLLEEMEISFRVAESDVKRIPNHGAALVVSNHPFGILDGAVLGALLCRLRDDVKIMTNFLLHGVAELQERCIFVDPFNRKGSSERNRHAVKNALLWLRSGHMLVVFPAGEVSHLRFNGQGVTDPKWNPMMARMARNAGAPTIPAFFRGRNSITFHLLGLMHPALRTAWLVNEFLNQRGKTVHVRIGTAVPASAIADMPDTEAIDYLRRRTYLLGQHRTSRGNASGAHLLPCARQEPIVAEAEPGVLLSELQELNAEQRVEDTRDFSVFVASAHEIPNLLLEIGRLREVTFRGVGEGTGRSRDLDEFDDYYLHVFLWDKHKQCVAGAYRMGICPEILNSRGPRGLYTSTLFRYEPEFFERLGPAVELGRSFVVPQYQRKYASLLLLWRGIGKYMSRNPETPVMFGAVSISARYSPASRELIIKYFESRCWDEMSQFVRPRRPFRPSPFQTWDCAGICRAMRDFEDLADSVSNLETDAKQIPILVRQYLHLGGRMLAFNVDRNFSNALDGLVLLDLRKTDPAMLQRYMGGEGLERFYSYHGLSATSGNSTTLCRRNRSADTDINVRSILR